MVELNVCGCVKVYVVVFLFIVIYTIILCCIKSLENIHKIDFMCKPIFNIKGHDYTLWPISHFLMYFVLAFVCREHWKMFLVLGIIWELFETWLGYVIDVKDRKPSTKDYNENWLSGNVDDIIFNIAGYICGSICYFAIQNIKKSNSISAIEETVQAAVKDSAALVPIEVPQIELPPPQIELPAPIPVAVV